MIEVYNFMENGAPTLNNGQFIAFTILFSVFFILSTIVLIEAYIKKNVEPKDILVEIAAFAILFLFVFLTVNSYKEESKIYNECVEIYSGGTYEVEEGKLTNFVSLENKVQYGYYDITFSVNSYFFDWDSFRYGNDCFPEKTISLLNDSTNVKVKYVEIENETIILAIEVS